MASTFIFNKCMVTFVAIFFLSTLINAQQTSDPAALCMNDGFQTTLQGNYYVSMICTSTATKQFPGVSLNSPSGLAVDNQGNGYICDPSSSLVYKVNSNSANTINYGVFQAPTGVAVDGQGNVYISDSGGNGNFPQVYQITSDGVINTLAVPQGGWGNPSGIAVDGQGSNIYVSDSVNQQIYQINIGGGGGGVNVLAGPNPQGGGWGNPSGIAVDGQGSNVYVSDSVNQQIYQISIDGGGGGGGVNVLAAPNPQGDGWGNPSGVAVDGQGNVYVSDSLNRQVYRIARDGSNTLMTGPYGGWFSPSGIAVDGQGNVYVSDSVLHAIYKISPIATLTQCSEPQGNQYVTTVCSLGSQQSLGSDTQFGDCGAFSNGVTFVQAGCSAGSSGIPGFPANVVSCSSICTQMNCVSQCNPNSCNNNYYIYNTCQSSSMYSPGNDTQFGDCGSFQNYRNWVTQGCLVGSIGQAGSAAQVTPCSNQIPSTGYVFQLCTSQDIFTAGSDIQYADCGSYSDNNNYVSTPCVVGSPAVTGSPLSTTPCSNLNYSQYNNGYYLSTTCSSPNAPYEIGFDYAYSPCSYPVCSNSDTDRTNACDKYVSVACIFNTVSTFTDDSGNSNQLITPGKDTVLSNCNPNSMQPIQPHHYISTNCVPGTYSRPGSNSMAPSTSAPTAPGTPTFTNPGHKSAYITPTSVYLTWTKSFYNGDTISSYTIYGPGSPSEDNLLLSVTSSLCPINPSFFCANVTGLTLGGTYNFTVTASNVDGEGRPSQISSPISLPDVPSAPGKPFVTSYNESYISFSWAQSTTDIYGDVVLNYLIFYVDATVSLNLSPASYACSPPRNGFSCYTLRNLSRGTFYSFWIVAVNAIGNSPYSAQLDDLKTFDVPSQPSAPMSIDYYLTDTQIVLQFVPSQNNGYSVSKYFFVETNNLISNFSLTPSNLGCPMNYASLNDTNYLCATLSGLKSGETYSFKVQSYNILGLSPWSFTSSTIKTNKVPSPPQMPYVNWATSNASAIVLRWDQNLFDLSGNAPILQYNIYGCKGISCVIISSHASDYLMGTLLTPSSTCSGCNFFVAEMVLTNSILSGNTYYFQLSAQNVVGESSFSSYSLPVVIPSVPSAPFNLRIQNVLSTNLNLLWSPSGETEGNAVTNFIVGYYFDNPANVLIFPTANLTSSGCFVNIGEPTTCYKLINLTYGTIYNFAISAVSVNGAGPYSDFISVTTDDVPSTPSTSYYDIGDLTANSLIIRWLQPLSSFRGSGTITGYNVYQSQNGSISLVTNYQVLSNITLCGISDCEVQIYIYNLSSGLSYSFGFSAINYVGESKVSSVVQFSTLTVPQTATNINFVPIFGMGTSAEVTWNSVVGGDTLYTVFTKIDPADTFIVATYTYSCFYDPGMEFSDFELQDFNYINCTATVSNMSPAMNYFICVQTTNYIGEGLSCYSDDPSNGGQGVITIGPYSSNGPPNQMIAPYITNSFTDVTPWMVHLYWQCLGFSDNNGATILGYIISQSLASTSFLPTTAINVSAVTCDVWVPNLLPQTSYYFFIQAYNSLGAGYISGASVSIATSSTPVAPTLIANSDGSLFSLSSSGTDVSFSWCEPNSYGIEILSYNISEFINSFSNAPQLSAVYNTLASSSCVPNTGNYTSCQYTVDYGAIVFTDICTYLVTGLAPDVAYVFQVAAISKVGIGTYSNPFSVLTPSLPISPTKFLGLPTNNSVYLTWGYPYFQTGSTMFQLTYGNIVHNITNSLSCIETNRNVHLSPDSFCFTVTRLSPNTTYNFTINAFDQNEKKAGLSAKCIVTTLAPPVVPGTPYSLNSDIYSNSLILRWSPGTNILQPTTYEIYACLNKLTSSDCEVQNSQNYGDTTCTNVDNANEVCQLLTGFIIGGNYYFKISASNSYGSSSFSSWSSLITLDNVPSQPAIPVVVYIADNNVVLQWPIPNNNGAPIFYYNAEYLQNYDSQPITATLLESNYCSFTFGLVCQQINNLIFGDTYTFRIYAVNSVGISIPSNYSSPTFINDTHPPQPGAPFADTLQSLYLLHNKVKIKWASGSGFGSVFGYNVYYAQASLSWSSVLTVNIVFDYLCDYPGYVCATIINLSPGTGYYFQVSAYNYVGNSPFSSISNLIVTMNIPNNVYNPTVYEIETTSVNLRWPSPNCAISSSSQCPNGWIRFGANCYLYINTPVANMVDALNSCQSLSSNLVSIQFAEENVFVANTFAVLQNIWIGYTFIGNSWVASDSSTFSYSNFNTSQNQISGYCVTLSQNNGLWSSVSNCSQLLPYVCKIPVIPITLHSVQLDANVPVVADTCDFPIIGYSVLLSNNSSIFTAINPNNYLLSLNCKSPDASTLYTCLEIDGLVSGSQYSVKIAPLNLAGPSANYSSVVSFLTNSAPQFQPNVNFSYTNILNDQASFQWASPITNGAVIQANYISDGTTSSTFYYTWDFTNCASGFNCASVYKLVYNTNYHLLLTLYNFAGTSTTYNMPSFITDNIPGAPGIPTVVPFTLFQTTVSLTWAYPVNDGNSPVQSYKIISASGQSFTVVFYTRNCYTGSICAYLYGLMPGKTDTFNVFSYNVLGWSTTSSSISITTPSKPTFPFENPSNSLIFSSYVNLRWLVPSKNGLDVQQYLLYSIVGGNYIMIPNTQVLFSLSTEPGYVHVTVLGLTKATSYAFVLVASNASPAKVDTNSTLQSNLFSTSTYSSSNLITTCDIPSTSSAPFVITVYNNLVFLKWLIFNNMNSYISSYEIFYIINNTAVSLKGSTQYFQNNCDAGYVCAVVKGLQPNTQYTVYVLATNFVGTSLSSSFINVFSTPGLPVNLLGTQISATVGYNSISLSWSPSLSNLISIQFYEVKLSLGNQNVSSVQSFTPCGTSNLICMTIQNLNPNTQYVASYRAYNDVGFGPFVDQPFPFQTATTQPPPSSFEILYVYSDSIYVKWPKNNVVYYPLQSYAVYINEVVWPTVSYDPICTVSGSYICGLIYNLNPNNSYNFTVQSVSEAGNGPASSKFSQSTRSTPVQPNTPISNFISNNAIDLTWLEVTPLNSNKVDSLQGYNITVTSNGTVTTLIDITYNDICESSGNGYACATINGLLPNTNYNFKISSFNFVGPSAFSLISATYLTYDAPSQPLLSPSILNEPYQVAITNNAIYLNLYQSASYNGGSLQSFFLSINCNPILKSPTCTCVTYLSNSVPSCYQPIDKWSSSYSFSGLMSGAYCDRGTNSSLCAAVFNLNSNTTYYFASTNINAYGISSFSNVQAVTTNTLPNPPSNFQIGIIQLQNEIDLTWSYNYDGGQFIESYQVFYSTTNITGSFSQVRQVIFSGLGNQVGFSTSGTVTATVFGLQTGTRYYFYVIATNGAGMSSISSIKSSLTISLPSIPAMLNSTNLLNTLETSISLTWPNALLSNTLNNAIQGYNFFIASSSSSFISLASNMTVYYSRSCKVGNLCAAIQLLSSNTLYFFRLNCFNIAGLSAFSNSSVTTTFVTDGVPFYNLNSNPCVEGCISNTPTYSSTFSSILPAYQISPISALVCWSNFYSNGEIINRYSGNVVSHPEAVVTFYNQNCLPLADTNRPCYSALNETFFIQNNAECAYISGLTIATPYTLNVTGCNFVGCGFSHPPAVTLSFATADMPYLTYLYSNESTISSLVPLFSPEVFKYALSTPMVLGDSNFHISPVMVSFAGLSIYASNPLASGDQTSVPVFVQCVPKVESEYDVSLFYDMDCALSGISFLSSQIIIQIRRGSMTLNSYYVEVIDSSPIAQMNPPELFYFNKNPSQILYVGPNQAQVRWSNPSELIDGNHALSSIILSVWDSLHNLINSVTLTPDSASGVIPNNHVITGLSANTQYQVTVKAINSFGTSIDSMPLKFTTPKDSPQIQAAQYLPSGAGFEVIFDFSVKFTDDSKLDNSNPKFDCKQILDPPTMNSLSSDLTVDALYPICIFTDIFTLTVYVHDLKASILQNVPTIQYNITILDNVVQYLVSGTTVAGNLKTQKMLLIPLGIIIPKISFIGALNIGACDNTFALNAGPTSGGSLLSFLWTLQGAQSSFLNFDNSTLANQFLIPNTYSFLNLDVSALTSYNFSISLNLQAINSLGGTSSLPIQLTYVNVHIPQLVIQGAVTQYKKSDNPEIIASAEFTPSSVCASFPSPQDDNLYWTLTRLSDDVQIDIDGLFSQGKRQFNLDFSKLPDVIVNEKYKLSFNFVRDNSYTTTSVFFNVISSPLMVNIAGNRIKHVSVVADDITGVVAPLEFDASSSYDPDDPKSKNLQFDWECLDVSSSLSCLDIFGNPFRFEVKNYGVVVINQILQGGLSLVVTVTVSSSFGRKITSTIPVFTYNSPLVDLSIQLSDIYNKPFVDSNGVYYISAADSVSFYSYFSTNGINSNNLDSSSWSFNIVEKLSNSISPTTVILSETAFDTSKFVITPTLYLLALNPNILAVGVTYVFQLTASFQDSNGQTRIGTYQVKVTTAIPASLGTISMNPPTGGEALSTMYTMTQIGWTASESDYPLTYLFSMAYSGSKGNPMSGTADVIATTGTIILAGYISSSVAAFQLPVPEIGNIYSSWYRGVSNGQYSATMIGTCKTAFGITATTKANILVNEPVSLSQYWSYVQDGVNQLLYTGATSYVSKFSDIPYTDPLSLVYSIIKSPLDIPNTQGYVIPVGSHFDTFISARITSDLIKLQGQLKALSAANNLQAFNSGIQLFSSILGYLDKLDSRPYPMFCNQVLQSGIDSSQEWNTIGLACKDLSGTATDIVDYSYFCPGGEIDPSTFSNAGTSTQTYYCDMIGNQLADYQYCDCGCFGCHGDNLGTTCQTSKNAPSVQQRIAFRAFLSGETKFSNTSVEAISSTITYLSQVSSTITQLQPTAILNVVSQLSDTLRSLNSLNSVLTPASQSLYVSIISNVLDGITGNTNLNATTTIDTTNAMLQSFVVNIVRTIADQLLPGQPSASLSSVNLNMAARKDLITQPGLPIKPIIVNSTSLTLGSNGYVIPSFGLSNSGLNAALVGITLLMGATNWKGSGPYILTNSNSNRRVLKSSPQTSNIQCIHYYTDLKPVCPSASLDPKNNCGLTEFSVTIPMLVNYAQIASSQGSSTGSSVKQRTITQYCKADEIYQMVFDCTFLNAYSMIYQCIGLNEEVTFVCPSQELVNSCSIYDTTSPPGVPMTNKDCKMTTDPYTLQSTFQAVCSCKSNLRALFDPPGNEKCFYTTVALSAAPIPPFDKMPIPPTQVWMDFVEEVKTTNLILFFIISCFVFLFVLKSISAVGAAISLNHEVVAIYKKKAIPKPRSRNNQVQRIGSAFWTHLKQNHSYFSIFFAKQAYENGEFMKSLSPFSYMYEEMLSRTQRALILTSAIILEFFIIVCGNEAIIIYCKTLPEHSKASLISRVYFEMATDLIGSNITVYQQLKNNNQLYGVNVTDDVYSGPKSLAPWRQCLYNTENSLLYTILIGAFSFLVSFGYIYFIAYVCKIVNIQWKNREEYILKVLKEIVAEIPKTKEAKKIKAKEVKDRLRALNDAAKSKSKNVEDSSGTKRDTSKEANSKDPAKEKLDLMEKKIDDISLPHVFTASLQDINPKTGLYHVLGKANTDVLQRNNATEEWIPPRDESYQFNPLYYPGLLHKTTDRNYDQKTKLGLYESNPYVVIKNYTAFGGMAGKILNRLPRSFSFRIIGITSFELKRYFTGKICKDSRVYELQDIKYSDKFKQGVDNKALNESDWNCGKLFVKITFKPLDISPDDRQFWTYLPGYFNLEIIEERFVIDIDYLLFKNSQLYSYSNRNLLAEKKKEMDGKIIQGQSQQDNTSKPVKISNYDALGSDLKNVGVYIMFLLLNGCIGFLTYYVTILPMNKEWSDKRALICIIGVLVPELLRFMLFDPLYLLYLDVKGLKKRVNSLEEENNDIIIPETSEVFVENILASDGISKVMPIHPEEFEEEDSSTLHFDEEDSFREAKSTGIKVVEIEITVNNDKKQVGIIKSLPDKDLRKDALYEDEDEKEEEDSDGEDW